MNFLESLSLLNNFKTDKYAIYRQNNTKKRVILTHLGDMFVEAKGMHQGWVRGELTIEDMLATDWNYDRKIN